MKKVLFAAAALSILSLPALAQQTPNGNSAGGPARMGAPGQVETMPMMKKPMMKKRMMKKRRMMKKKMM